MAARSCGETPVGRGMGLTDGPTMNVSYCHARTRLAHTSDEERG